MQKILVVEDDFDIQELLQNFLQEAGYEVVTASDGIEAIDVFSDKQFNFPSVGLKPPPLGGQALAVLQ